MLPPFDPEDPMATEQKSPSDFLTYVNRPEISETYVDGLQLIFFDGHSVKIELVAYRFETPKPPAPPSGQKITAARLVLSPQAAEALLNGLSQIAAAVQQEAKVQSQSPVKPSKPH